jgi:hypothetical protein
MQVPCVSHGCAEDLLGSVIAEHLKKALVDVHVPAFPGNDNSVVGVFYRGAVPLFGLPELSFQPGPVKSDFNSYTKLSLIDRLKDVPEWFSNLGPIKCSLVCVGGDVNHGAGACGPDGFSGLDAIHRSLQGNVHKDHIGVEGQNARNRLFSGSTRTQGLIAEPPEMFSNFHSCRLFVLDDKYTLVSH